MKTKKIGYASLLLIVFVTASGCGRAYSGVYTGTETVTLNGMPIPPSTVSLTLNQGQNDSVTGIWQGTSGTGVIQGTLVNGNQLNINVTITSSNNYAANGAYGYGQQPYAYPNTAYPTSSSSCGTGVYSGSLTLNSANQISGILSLLPTGQAVPIAGQPQLPSQQYPAGMSCTGTRSITAGK